MKNFLSQEQSTAIKLRVDEFDNKNKENSDFEQALKAIQSLISDCLHIALSQDSQQHSSQLFEAMDYATNGGKRLRAFLVLTVNRLFGGNTLDAIYAAMAIEMIHAYSLVHDDLPDMDNDDCRRGKASVHKKFDNALAILVGDALQAQAYEVMSYSALDPQIRLQQVVCLSRAAGTKGMVLGQTIDMISHFSRYDLDKLKQMHSLKTGALLSASVELGYRSASLDQVSILDKFAIHIGLAYQIRDDIIDLIGNQITLGKSVAKDITTNKSTFVTILGLENSQEYLSQTLSQARECLHKLSDLDSVAIEWLFNLVDKLETRES